MVVNSCVYFYTPRIDETFKASHQNQKTKEKFERFFYIKKKKEK